MRYLIECFAALGKANDLDLSLNIQTIDGVRGYSKVLFISFNAV